MLLPLPPLAGPSTSLTTLGLTKHLTLTLASSPTLSSRSNLSTSVRLARLRPPSSFLPVRRFSASPQQGQEHAEHLQQHEPHSRQEEPHPSSSSQSSNITKPNGASPTSPSSSTSSSPSPSAPQGLTGSDLLFLQAEREERDEAAQAQARARQAQEQRLKDPAWDGEERLQHAILRVQEAEHQPLKIRNDTVRTPPISSAPNSTVPSSSSSEKPEPIKPVFGGPLEGGRYLEKTPDGQPWNAIFVRPSHLQSKKYAESSSKAQEGFGGSVYTGKYLASGGGGGGGGVGTSQGSGGYAARLRAVGVTDFKRLPLDDAKKMKAIREALHRVERAGRIGKAREGAADYQRSKELEVLLQKVGDEPGGHGTEVLDDVEDVGEGRGEGEGEGDGEHRTKLQQSRRRGKSGPSLAAMSGRAWASLVNERIEEAMRGEEWKNNSLRGKPMAVDVHEWNPHVKGEERIMNRIVQRQGGAPPFVELNAELNLALTSFRKRLIQSWVRRASRIILSGDLKRGLEPLVQAKVGVKESESGEREEEKVEEQGKILAKARRVEDAGVSSSGNASASGMNSSNDSAATAAPMLSTHASPTPGQSKLLHLAGTFRDREWEASESAYHSASLSDLNKIVRRYNAEAPFTARRAPLVVDIELQRAYKDAQASLAQALSDGLIELRRGKEERSREEREMRRRKSKGDLLARMASALNIGWRDSSLAQPLPKGNEDPTKRLESGVQRRLDEDGSLGASQGEAGLGIDQGADRKERRGKGGWSLLEMVRVVFRSARNLVGR